MKLVERRDLCRSVYSCLVTAGPNWKEIKYQRMDQLNKCGTIRVMLIHQRTEQRHPEEHGTAKKLVSTSTGGRNRDTLCMTGVILSSWGGGGAYQSLVTEASTVERRQTGSQKNSFRGDANAPASVERISMWLSSVKLFKNLKLSAKVWLYFTQVTFLNL